MRHLIISATLLFIFAINAQALACGNAGVGLKQPIFVKEYHVFTLAPKSGGRMKCGGRHLEGADFRIYWSSQDEAARQGSGCDNLANGRAKRTTVGKLDMFTFRYTGPDGLYGCSGSYALIN